MKQNTKLTIIHIIFLCVIATMTTLNAASLIDPSAEVFTFNKALAKKGDKLAQFKIGYMYEMGEGIEQSEKQAIKWYRLASTKNYRPAKLRLRYLTVKKRRFLVKADKPWLQRVKNDAFANDVQALFLLGQLYRRGLGVEKDLDKSLEIMYQLGTEGLQAVDKEIVLIKQEKGSKKKTIKKTKKKSKKYSNKKKRKKKVKKKSSTSKAEALTKKQRYDAVMEKMKLEQEEIDKLQGWSEGADTNELNADDEI